MCRFLQLLLVCLFATTTPLAHSAEEDLTLTVSVREVPPFARQREDGSWSGISVELWQKISESAGWITQWEPVPSVQDQVDALAARTVDVAVGAMSMTPEREVMIDFSHSFFTTSLAIATPNRDSGWLALLEQLISPDFLKAVGALIVLLFGVGFVIWMVERRSNTDQFGGDALHGIGNGFWWSAVTMTTVGYGDKAPATPLGRFIATIWMFISVITISGFTAAIASSVTLDSAQSRIQSVQDLAKAKTYSVPGSTGAQTLEKLGISSRDVADAQTGVQLLLNGKAEAFVFDQAVLQYLLNQADADIEIIPIPRTSQSYAFGLPQDFPHAEQMNREILRIMQSEQWGQILRNHLGK